jgi:pyruvate, water dikinase
MSAMPLTETLDEAVFGGKAAQLALATVAGLPVPPGVALSCDFVESVATGAEAVATEMEASCRDLQRPLAARSSAVGEDSEAASFAGQHLTCLNVSSLPALVDAVRAIWESAHSASALAYRRRLGLEDEPRIGVVVQELVPADCAGVLFTRNPVDGSDEILIEASWGLGEAVVAGLVTPDRFRLTRDGTVLERVPGTKDLAIEAAPDGGTRQTETPARRVHELCLDDAELGELCALALQCEEVFGGTQDVEWTFADGSLYLLQRRALTGRR